MKLTLSSGIGCVQRNEQINAPTPLPTHPRSPSVIACVEGLLTRGTPHGPAPPSMQQQRLRADADYGVDVERPTGIETRDIGRRRGEGKRAVQATDARTVRVDTRSISQIGFLQHKLASDFR